MSAAPDHTSASSPHAANNGSARTRGALDALVPRAWRVGARFAVWRGGFPCGAVLVLLGTAIPAYGGLTVLGIWVLLFAFMLRLLRWKLRGLRTQTPAAPARTETPTPVAPPAAPTVSGPTYYMADAMPYQGGANPAPGSDDTSFPRA